MDPVLNFNTLNRARYEANACLYQRCAAESYAIARERLFMGNLEAAAEWQDDAAWHARMAMIALARLIECNTNQGA